MTLIDATYFIGELNIANLDQQGVSDNLDIFINKYEKRYLELLLGQDLYDAFIAGLSNNPVEQKWTDLLNILVNEPAKESPIANYVYYWYRRSEVTQTVGMGEVRPTAENAAIVSPAEKMVRAWNEMVWMNFKIAKFIGDHESDYPDYPYPYPVIVNGTSYLDGYSYCWANSPYRKRYPDIFYRINSLNI